MDVNVYIDLKARAVKMLPFSLSGGPYEEERLLLLRVVRFPVCLFVCVSFVTRHYQIFT